MKRLRDIHGFQRRIEDLEAQLGGRGEPGPDGTDSWDSTLFGVLATNSNVASAIISFDPAEDTVESILMTAVGKQDYVTPLGSADHGGMGRAIVIYRHLDIVTVVGQTSLWSHSTTGMNISATASGSTCSLRVQAANATVVNWTAIARRQIY